MENENDLTLHHPSSGACITMTSSSSSSCFAVHDEFHYSRIHCSGEHDGGAAANNHHNHSDNHRKRGVGRRWRNLLRRFIKEGKISCGSKPLSFKYDPVSYSQNFDDGGSHLHEPPRGIPMFFNDLSSGPVLNRLEPSEKRE